MEHATHGFTELQSRSRRTDGCGEETGELLEEEERPPSSSHAASARQRGEAVRIGTKRHWVLYDRSTGRPKPCGEWQQIRGGWLPVGRLSGSVVAYRSILRFSGRPPMTQQAAALGMIARHHTSPPIHQTNPHTASPMHKQTSKQASEGSPVRRVEPRRRRDLSSL